MEGQILYFNQPSRPRAHKMPARSARQRFQVKGTYNKNRDNCYSSARLLNQGAILADRAYFVFCFLTGKHDRAYFVFCFLTEKHDRVYILCSVSMFTHQLIYYLHCRAQWWLHPFTLVFLTKKHDRAYFVFCFLTEKHDRAYFAFCANLRIKLTSARISFECRKQLNNQTISPSTRRTSGSLIFCLIITLYLPRSWHSIFIINFYPVCFYLLFA